MKSILILAVHPDPVLESWRWQAFPELKDLGLRCMAEATDVRDLVSQLLEHHGYHALEASNGGEALLTCERFEGDIHLMLADVMMPQMNCPELAQRLKPLRPDMRVLFMSGYLDETVSLGETDAFVLKPFNQRTLLENIRNLLGREG